MKFELKSFRVLIVDDTNDIHKDIRKILSWKPPSKSRLQHIESALFKDEEPSKPTPQYQLPSLNLDSAFQGSEAVEMVENAIREKNPYQLIFMDVRMPPGMDGIETIQKIWQIQPDVNAVICTAYSDYSIESIHDKLGISDKMLFLTKPFSSAVLKQSAITLLKKWDVDHQLQEHLKNLETLVTDRTAMLLESSKLAALGEMAGGLAHEVNTPLATIGLMIQQIKPTPESEANIRTISLMVKRIAKIVSALRSIAKSNSDASFELVPVNQIVEDVKTLCGERFKEADIILRISNTPNEVIECHPNEISQVILNLLNNAHDAVLKLPEKWVHLDFENQGSSIRIRITDSGSGIPENVASKIFDPFYTTKEIGQGTGLGLSAAKGIVEKHNGSISVDRSSKNTSFIIDLPKFQVRRK